MCERLKVPNVSDELVCFLTDELKDIDSNKARLLFYTLLLDKYSVPQNDSLRFNTRHHLSVTELKSLLRARGFTRPI